MLKCGDIMALYECTSSSAYRKIARIKRKYNKMHVKYISMDDFCDYTGWKEERVNFMLDNPLHTKKLLAGNKAWLT